MAELELEDVPLPLTEHDRVGEVVRLEASAGAIHLEEVRMNVKRIDQVEFKRVDDVEAHFLAHDRG